MIDWGAVSDAIGAATGREFRAREQRSVGGGCISEAVVLSGDQQRYFVKLNRAEMAPMFAAEAAGLAAIAETGAIRTPGVITHGCHADQAFLVLEYIAFGAPTSATSRQLGEQLAAMHHVSAETFGWVRDNSIGATPQVNTRESDWLTFFREHRLRYQLQLAGSNGAAAALLDGGEQLLQQLPQFFTTYQPRPSLLHGDLWGGNWGADEAGAPVLFDPATYYGDRESDLAMTELFGGFDADFYRAYRGAWALDPGYGTRKTLYKLYHVLNHFNLFGGSYAGQARHMIESLLAELG